MYALLDSLTYRCLVNIHQPRPELSSSLKSPKSPGRLNKKMCAHLFVSQSCPWLLILPFFSWAQVPLLPGSARPCAHAPQETFRFAQLPAPGGTAPGYFASEGTKEIHKLTRLLLPKLFLCFGFSHLTGAC